jgi:hypothetical protein
MSASISAHSTTSTEVGSAQPEPTRRSRKDQQAPHSSGSGALDGSRTRGMITENMRPKLERKTFFWRVSAVVAATGSSASWLATASRRSSLLVKSRGGSVRRSLAAEAHLGLSSSSDQSGRSSSNSKSESAIVPSIDSPAAKPHSRSRHTVSRMKALDRKQSLAVLLL